MNSDKNIQTIYITHFKEVCSTILRYFRVQNICIEIVVIEKQA